MSIYENTLHINFPQTKACPNLLWASSILFWGKNEINSRRVIGDLRSKKEESICAYHCIHVSYIRYTHI